MTSVHDLSDAELREELARTRSDYAEYVEDVGEHPSHASRDLGDGARRHLDVREELDRRAAGHHDVPRGRDAGGQAGSGHVDPAELVASRQASYDDASQDAGASGSGDAGSRQGGSGQEGAGTGGSADAASEESGAEHENLPDKLDPGEIEPYA